MDNNAYLASKPRYEIPDGLYEAFCMFPVCAK